MLLYDDWNLTFDRSFILLVFLLQVLFILKFDFSLALANQRLTSDVVLLEEVLYALFLIYLIILLDKVWIILFNYIHLWPRLFDKLAVVEGRVSEQLLSIEVVWDGKRGLVALLT